MVVMSVGNDMRRVITMDYCAVENFRNLKEILIETFVTGRVRCGILLCGIIAIEICINTEGFLQAGKDFDI